MQVLLLVDGNNIWWRSYHALKPRMGQPGERPTWAIHGFLQSVAWFVRRYEPTHLLIAFDGGASVYRREIYPDYKSGRQPATGIDFALAREEMAHLRRLLTAMGVPVQMDAGVEADDVITEAVARCGAMSTLIVSGDKDLRQLVSPSVTVLEPSHAHGSHERIWDEQTVLNEYGVPASRLSDLLSLTGDTSDGVPGVRGIGPKKAAAILASYPSLETAIKGDERLRDFEAEIEMARRLVELRPGVASWPWADGLRLRWDPIEPSDPLGPSVVRLLLILGLEKVREQWETGLLWQNPPFDTRSLADELAEREQQRLAV